MSTVTLTQAKNALTIDYTDQDTLIQSYIDGAEEWVERMTDTKLTSASATDYCNGGSYGLRPTARLPITSITSVYDMEASATEPATEYHLRQNAIYRDSGGRWDAGRVNRWRVILVGGYDDDTRPPGLIAIILDLVYRAYNARGDKKEQSAAGYSVVWSDFADSEMLNKLDSYRTGGSLLG